MLELGSSGSMRGVPSNEHPYRDPRSGIERKPVCAHRTIATPWASRTNWRTAWNATSGSSAQAWIHKSPPVRVSISWSPSKGGKSRRAGGRCAASPYRSFPSFRNNPAPNPKVKVSRAAGHGPRRYPARPLRHPVQSVAPARRGSFLLRQ